MHVDSDLSAYLDGELAPADRTRVDAHLGSCGRCRARLGELRATAALVAALPAPHPSRSLVPVVTQRWSWLRPVRALSAIATGAFLFAFLLTALGRYGGGLGGGDESTAIFGGAGPTAAPAAAPAGASAPRAASATRPPAPQVPGAFAAASPTALNGSAAATAAPKAAPAPGTTPALAPSAASGKELARSTGVATAQHVVVLDRSGPLLEPLFWLGLAVIAAVVAIAAHRRLRVG